MTQNQLIQLAAKWINGKTNDEERYLLESWYHDFRPNPYAELSDVDYEELEAEILQRIRFARNRKQNLQIKLQYWLSRAAIWLTVVSVAALVYVKRNNLINWANPVKQVTYAAAKGQVIKVQLPDGSSVWLNSGSSINFPDQFRHDTRVVKLSGEAYFDVKHINTVPFIVYAGNIKTQVLGTSFNIKAYQSLDHVIIAVATGKVAVSIMLRQKPAKPVMLTPNQQVTYNKITSKITKQHTDTDAVAGWIKGNYRFVDVSLADVALALENRFNVHIEITDRDLAKKKITASFERTDPLSQILEAIRQTTGLKYQIVTAKQIKWY